MKARIDALLNSWVSKKLMVFFVASFGLFSGTLTSSDWVTVSAIYLGTQGVIDALAKLRQQN
jgi:hypothetical protein